MASNVVKSLNLPCGGTFPLIGLGTSTNNATGKCGEVFDAVKTAIDIGYRHIDCAYSYGNEEEVGNAIQAKLEDGTIKNKKDVFITTKLWLTWYNPSMVRECAMKSLKALKVDSIQLYLMHWPFGFKDGDTLFPKDKNGKVIYSDHDYVDTWKAMENLVDEKLVENIGVSNFNKSQLERLMQNCRIKPCNLQIEVHPYLANRKLVDFCQSNGITVTAYAPLCNASRPWKASDEPNIFDDPVLKEISKSKIKSIAQVVLRFLIQRNIIAVPKSVTPRRIQENFDVFDFQLSDDEMKKIFSLDRNLRLYKFPEFKDHKFYPFHDEY